VLALLLVPTIATTQTSCSQVVAEGLQPTQILGDKKCTSKLKYTTGDLHNMVQSCFQHLNMNSIQMFGAPIIPIFGINQCVCIADKIRKNHECVEDYMILVENNTASELLGKYSVECILEGAMGEAARKAFIGASTDNETKNTYPPATEKKEELKIEPEIFEKDTNSKKPVTWDDLINK
jgi:hypothetical protein